MILQHDKSREFRALLVYFVLVVLGYWPITSLSFSVISGDITDCWLSWYTFIGQTVSDGSFPNWNPFQQGGYPIFADLQGPAWFPGTYLLANTIGHSIYSILLIILACLILAGMGMYRLARLFTCDHRSAVLLGVVYICSGFFLQHMMHLYAFMSGAFIVWLLYYLCRLLESPNRSDALKASVIAFFQLSAGNHTFSIILVYLIISLAVTKYISLPRTQRRQWFVGLLIYGSSFLLITVLLGFGVFYSYLEISSHFSRGDGLTLEAAQYGSAVWLSIYSFLFPYSAGTSIAEVGMESNIENLYIGVFSLMLLLFALLRRRSQYENVLLMFGAVCLIASFGPAFPVHEVLFRFLPGMNLFRFPGYFSFFTILCWLPVAGRTLSEWPAVSNRTKPLFRPLALLLGIGSFLIGIVHLSDLSIERFTLLNAELTLFQKITFASWHERLAVNAFILGLLLIGTFLALRRNQPQKRLFTFIWVEAILTLQLCIWNSSVNEIPPSVINEPIIAAPSVATIPDQLPMRMHEDSTFVASRLWRNTNNYLKRPSHDGFNSFWLAKHVALENDKATFDALRSLPFIFQHNGNIESARTVNVEWHSFKPGRITFSVIGSTLPYIGIQQTPFPGWVARRNQKSVEISDRIVSTMSVARSGATDELELTFERPELRWIYLASLLLLTVILVYWSLHMSGLSLSGRNLMAVSIVLCSIIACSHEFRSPRSEEIHKSWSSLCRHIAQQQVITDDALFIADVGDNAHLVSGKLPKSTAYQRIDRPENIRKISGLISDFDGSSIAWVWSDRTPIPEVQGFLHSYFPYSEHEWTDGTSGIMVRSRTETAHPEFVYVLAEGQEFTSATNLSLDSLLDIPGSHLCFSVAGKAPSFEHQYLVATVKAGERTTFYQAMPFALFADGNGIAHPHLVINKDRFKHSTGNIQLYVWNEARRKLAVGNVTARSIDLVD
jgi:hypothetical protein